MIKIKNPCSENWENMQDAPEGKFCEKCSKCVIDFTEKTNVQIQEIMKQAEGKEICGRISVKSLSAMAAGIILITNLTFVQAQTKKDFGIATEQKTMNRTKVSGKLIFKRTKKEIPNAEVFFIHKSKYIKTTTDENGNFIIEIPNELVKRKNVLYFDFGKLNQETYKNLDRKPQNVMNGDIYENTSIIFTKKQQINGKEFQIDSQSTYVGGVVIMTERPPDYYYFNGKSVSEKKFEKLRKANPAFQFFIFDHKEAEVVAGESYINTVRLLFSE
jgi:hypothetical protein